MGRYNLKKIETKNLIPDFHRISQVSFYGLTSVFSQPCLWPCICCIPGRHLKRQTIVTCQNLILKRVNVCVAVMSLILCLLSHCSAKSKWHVVLLQGNLWHTASYIQQHMDVGIYWVNYTSQCLYKCSYFKRGCDTAADSLNGHQFYSLCFSISSLICFGAQLL